MRLQKQTKFYNKETGERGDCLRACLSSLLDVDIEFFEHHTWIGDYIELLPSLGFAYLGTATEIDLLDSCGVDGYYIAYGMGNRGVNHAVIIDDFGNIVHDPHPSDDGIQEIKGIFMIERF